MLGGMHHLSLATVLLLTNLACVSSEPPPPPVYIGVAQRDITPPPGYRMAGYFYERRATGTHDPLFAKAIVFKQIDVARQARRGRSMPPPYIRFAIVVCDLCHMSPAVVAQAREIAYRETKINPEHILIAATHTHTGPDYFGVLFEHLRKLAMLANNGVDPTEPGDYRKDLAEKIAAAIIEANEKAEPAEIRVGQAMQENLAFNRRYVMKDGSVGWNPGKNNPNIDKPAGPIDPAINIMTFGGDEPRAVLTNFALHADTVGGTEFSADFPYYLAELLRGVDGDKLVSVFGNGTCGDINHINVNSNQPQKGHAEAERIGVALGKHVLDGMKNLRAVESPRLAVRSERIDLPLQQFTPEEVAAARKQFDTIQERKLPFLVGVKATKIMKVYDQRLGQPVAAQVQVFRISDDVAIVGLPSEIFVELGLSIKQRSPFRQTFIIELANDSFGYVPTKRAFAEGNYEPTNSLIAPGGGERLADKAVEMLSAVK
jgi:hypothetical protein